MGKSSFFLAFALNSMRSHQLYILSYYIFLIKTFYSHMVPEDRMARLYNILKTQSTIYQPPEIMFISFVGSIHFHEYRDPIQSTLS